MIHDLWCFTRAWYRHVFLPSLSLWPKVTSVPGHFLKTMNSRLVLVTLSQQHASLTTGSIFSRMETGRGFSQSWMYMREGRAVSFTNREYESLKTWFLWITNAYMLGVRYCDLTRKHSRFTIHDNYSWFILWYSRFVIITYDSWLWFVICDSRFVISTDRDKLSFRIPASCVHDIRFTIHNPEFLGAKSWIKSRMIQNKAKSLNKLIQVIESDSWCCCQSLFYSCEFVHSQRKERKRSLPQLQLKHPGVGAATFLFLGMWDPRRKKRKKSS